MGKTLQISSLPEGGISYTILSQCLLVEKKVKVYNYGTLCPKKINYIGNHYIHKTFGHFLTKQYILLLAIAIKYSTLGRGSIHFQVCSEGIFVLYL